MEIASLFSGAGGLDRGFKNAGFDITWANENDKFIWSTINDNFPDTKLDTRSILDVPSEEIPDVDGIIGGPPCQSWSEAGALRGIEDSRGKLFFEYIRILRDKRPAFFLAENVSGILMKRHREAFQFILGQFANLGYSISFELLNAKNYGVPQDRKRVIIVGYHQLTGDFFEFPNASKESPVLKDAIGDLGEPEGTKSAALTDLEFPNHEYMTGDFSPMYMSRNRVRSWNEPSFTIQAGARHAPIHPQAPKMIPVERDKKIFAPGKEHLYRRLSVRECARIQTFPDEHTFSYERITNGYKMVGNAVPVKSAEYLARKIFSDFKGEG